MRAPRSLHDVETWLLGVGCGYEVVALATGRLPTITRLTMGLDPRVRGCVASVGYVWMLVHLGVLHR